MDLINTQANYSMLYYKQFSQTNAKIPEQYGFKPSLHNLNSTWDFTTATQAIKSVINLL